MNYDAKRYYAFLGVDPACSDEEVRAAFRRRAKQLHPDAETGNENDFIRLKKVYDVLGQPTKRAHYDRISRPRARRTAVPAVSARAPDWIGPAPRPRRFRLGGMSLLRFAAAFVFMAGLSLAALEVILADGGASPAAVFDASGRRATSSREAIARGITADPSQFATKDLPRIRQPNESIDAFAERMRSTRNDSPDLGSAER